MNKIGWAVEALLKNQQVTRVLWRNLDFNIDNEQAEEACRSYAISFLYYWKQPDDFVNIDGAIYAVDQYNVHKVWVPTQSDLMADDYILMEPKSMEQEFRGMLAE